LVSGTSPKSRGEPVFNHRQRFDNDSSDGSSEYLRSQSDVSLFFTKESFAASKFGGIWINEVLDAYGKGHWVLIVDADELFVYPQYETVRLPRLVEYLDNKGAQAMIAPLLDMYSDKAISDTEYLAGNSFVEACPYFDGDAYKNKDLDPDGFKVTERGGARHRLFWQARDRNYPSPYLYKIPLIKWKDGIALEASTHVLHNVKLAQATGVLLHFKLLQDFAGRAKLEATRKEHLADAREYVAFRDPYSQWIRESVTYSEVMSSQSNLSAFYEGSVHYENSTQLLRLGIMYMPKDFPEVKCP